MNELDKAKIISNFMDSDDDDDSDENVSTKQVPSLPPVQAPLNSLQNKYIAVMVLACGTLLQKK